MLRSKPILLAVAVLLTASLACSVQGNAIPTPDPNLVNTAIAQTLAAQTGQVIPITGLGSPTPTLTPTFTPSPTLSPTPLFTSTPLVPQITVSVATNCRTGPGKAYDRVGALLVGEMAQVFGQDPTGRYWYIRNPDSGAEFCWLWGEYATLTGNTIFLPIFTPPPSPTPVPSFEASYDGKDSCGNWWVEVKLKNTGGVAFKSISVTLRDTVTKKVLSLSADGFTNIDGCTVSSTKDTLDLSGTRVVSLPDFSYDPTGHKLRATITLCTEKALGGTCSTQVIRFTP